MLSLCSRVTCQVDTGYTNNIFKVAREPARRAYIRVGLGLGEGLGEGLGSVCECMHFLPAL